MEKTLASYLQTTLHVFSLVCYINHTNVYIIILEYSKILTSLTTMGFPVTNNNVRRYDLLVEFAPDSARYFHPSIKLLVIFWITETTCCTETLLTQLFRIELSIPGWKFVCTCIIIFFVCTRLFLRNKNYKLWNYVYPFMKNCNVTAVNNNKQQRAVREHQAWKCYCFQKRK